MRFLPRAAFVLAALAFASAALGQDPDARKKEPGEGRLHLEVDRGDPAKDFALAEEHAAARRWDAAASILDRLLRERAAGESLVPVPAGEGKPPRLVSVQALARARLLALPAE